MSLPEYQDYDRYTTPELVEELEAKADMLPRNHRELFWAAAKRLRAAPPPASPGDRPLPSDIELARLRDVLSKARHVLYDVAALQAMQPQPRGGQNVGMRLAYMIEQRTISKARRVMEAMEPLAIAAGEPPVELPPAEVPADATEAACEAFCPAYFGGITWLIMDEPQKAHLRQAIAAALAAKPAGTEER